MADIASRSREATTSLVYDFHYIARSVLHQIEEEHRIAGYNQEASTSHGPSIRSPVSSTPIRMQPIRGRGRRRVDRRGHGRDGEGGHGTPKPTLPTSIPPPPPPPLLLTHHPILPYFLILTHHSIFLYPQRLTHLYHLRCRQSQIQWQ